MGARGQRSVAGQRSGILTASLISSEIQVSDFARLTPEIMGSACFYAKNDWLDSLLVRAQWHGHHDDDRSVRVVHDFVCMQLKQLAQAFESLYRQTGNATGFVAS